MESDLIPGVTDVVGARGHDRVRKHTARKVNQQIDLETNACIQKTIAGGRDAIVARVHELDREWDVDRALLTLFGVFGGAAFGLGQRFRGFRYLHAAQLGFMFIHATAGWCPPLPVLRRLGFRTAREIAAERFALVEKLSGRSLVSPH